MRNINTPVPVREAMHIKRALLLNRHKSTINSEQDWTSVDLSGNDHL